MDSYKSRSAAARQHHLCAPSGTHLHHLVCCGLAAGPDRGRFWVLRASDNTTDEQLVAKRRNKLMTVTRGFAATVIFAGLAVGTASAAWADTALSGHYIRSEMSQSGQSETDDWYATPCGDGCASIASTPGGPAISQARLVNGQWTLTSASHTLACPDGTVVPNAVNAYYTWDPNTLAGTVQIISQGPACNIPAGYQKTNSVQFTHVP
jgi:hypothetical protein